MRGLLSCKCIARYIKWFFSWYFDAHLRVTERVFPVSDFSPLPLHCYFIINYNIAGRLISYSMNKDQKVLLRAIYNEKTSMNSMQQPVEKPF